MLIGGKKALHVSEVNGKTVYRYSIQCMDQFD